MRAIPPEEKGQFTDIETRRSTFTLDAPIHHILWIRVAWLIVTLLVGCLIPWLVYLFGSDPAAASNAVTTKIKDVSGLPIYFTFTRLIIPDIGL